MQNTKLEIILLIVIVLLSAGNVFSAPLPPTPVGGDLWPYVTTGAVLGLGAWRMWKK